jgi:hypothetical protein
VTLPLIDDLTHILTLARANAELPEASYHVVIVPDSGDHVLRDFPTPEEAAEFIRTYAGKDIKVRVFYGRHCPTTKAPAKFLVTHAGRFPLFQAESGDEIDETGSMIPATTKPPALEADVIDEDPDDASDEDDEDKEDDLDDL